MEATIALVAMHALWLCGGAEWLAVSAAARAAMVALDMGHQETSSQGICSGASFMASLFVLSGTLAGGAPLLGFVLLV